MPQISVVLVDDHAVLRQGLRSLLERESAFSVIGVDDPYDLLTDSERAVLVLAAQGLTSSAISPRTVEAYRANLLHKLELRNQSELVCYAIKRGLIALE
jgi:DNA-binding NarL/FixJ family response regulator